LSRKLSAAAAIWLCALAGCGGDDGKVSRTGPSTPEELETGQLDRRPTPMSYEEVAKAKDGSPERAVLQLMFWGQWGSPQGVLARYSPRALRVAGAENIAGIYLANRDYLASTLPRIETTRSVGRRRVVAGRLLTHESPPRAESFVLTPGRGRWQILYDSFVQSSLAEYVQGEVQNTRHALASDDEPPDRAAVAAGREAAAKYGELALPAGGD
jgi:hypothetical protein